MQGAVTQVPRIGLKTKFHFWPDKYWSGGNPPDIDKFGPLTEHETAIFQFGLPHKHGQPYSNMIKQTLHKLTHVMSHVVTI
jgi:hypothetical protein